jgi:hypothetical protein
MITLVFSPKQHLPINMQHSVGISKQYIPISKKRTILKKELFQKKNYFKKRIISKIIFCQILFSDH